MIDTFHFPKDFSDLISTYPIPKMFEVKQHFQEDYLENPIAELRSQLARGIVHEQLSKIKKGDSVAIGCGSRGIANLSVFLKELVDQINMRGGSPFIFPAMGSHGGASAQGQLDILSGYGVTEESTGAPIRATMDVVSIGLTEDERPTYLDAYASQADHILLINRIKAHTAFQGLYESGLMKMLVIGLGKHAGARLCHDAGFGEMATNIPIFARSMLRHASILLGVGLVENGYGQTCKIAALAPKEIPEREPELLHYAKSRMGRILFQGCDLLIVDWLGKNISGEGMDPNITGRFPTPLCTSTFSAQKLAVLDITPESHGNCYGVGLADITTKRMMDHSDVVSMYINAVTNTVLDAVKIPMVCKNHREAIGAGITTCVKIDRLKPRIIRISNTEDLRTIQISEALLDEANNNSDIEILSKALDMGFDDEGNLF